MTRRWTDASISAQMTVDGQPRGTESTPGTRIRPASAADLVALGGIRTAGEQGGLLPVLGASAWRNVLREYLRDPGSILLVAASPDDEIHGYSLATARSVIVQRRAIARSPTLWIAAAKGALRQPGAIAPIIRRAAHVIRPARSDSVRPEPSLRLLDIVVASEARGRGLGRALLEETLDAAAAMGYREIGLSVLADNAAGIGLYERSGFLPSGQGIRADGRAYLTMRRPI